MVRVDIRPLKNLAEFRQCEELQMAVWGSLGAGSEVFTVTQKYGGAVLGTLVDGKVVGFIYAFLARYRGRLVHWSHMMAVAEGFRDQGFGYRMKLAHRTLALSQGIKSICWTYDPLQSRNASLNLCRLGARVEEYVEDCYGHFASRIEKGLPSDRFVVNWRLGPAPGVKGVKGASADGLPRVNETHLDSRGFIVNQKIHLRQKGPRLLVEIPATTDEMRAKALSLALRWRLETRKVFTRYLSVGYRVAGFIPPNSGGEGRCFYLLERGGRTTLAGGQRG